jgi:putative peptidoglycan lipid II flippase
VSRRIVRSAGIVAAATLLSRVTGLVRETVMARLFGAGTAYDAFLLGFRLPNLTRDLFAEGALSSSFVPVFTRSLTQKGKADAARLFNLVATALILAVGAFCALGMIFSPQLVGLMAPGFKEVPGKFELAVLLSRIMFPFLLLVALAAQAMGVLNACDRFAVPTLASTFFNVGSVAFGLLFGWVAAASLGLGMVHSMAIGIVFGGALQLFWQVPSLVREGFAYRPRIDFSDPGLRQVFKLMGPAILGNAAVQINVLVNTNFASGITDAQGHVMNGPVSWLTYAFRFMQLPVGIFGVAIASASLPEVSRSAASGRMDEFRVTVARALGLVLLLTIPSSVGLFVLRETMVGAVYEWGHFLYSDTRQTGLAVACYAVGLSGYCVSKILTPSFYALNDARTPMLVSVSSIAVNFAVASTMVRFSGLGHAGLALATSAVSIFGAIALALILRMRLGYFGGGILFATVWRVVASSAVMGAACWASSAGLRHLLGPGKRFYLVDVALSIPLGAIVFYAVASALGTAELEAAKTALAGPLATWFSKQRDTLR